MICKGSLGLSHWVFLNLDMYLGLKIHHFYAVCMCRLYLRMIAPFVQAGVLGIM